MNREIDYQQSLINEVVQRKGIKAFLFDLDDTLILTHQTFINRMEQFAAHVGQESGEQQDVVLSRMMDALDGMRAELGLHPRLMHETARVTTLHHGLDFESHLTQAQLGQLMQIYDGVDARQIPGVSGVLGLLHATSADIYVVTHASRENTTGKIRAAQLHGRFKGVFCIDPTGKKDEHAWNNVIADRLQLAPSQVFVMGDSWVSDIAPVLNLGVPKDQVLRVRTEYGHANKGVVEGITEIDSVRDVPEYLLRLL